MKIGRCIAKMTALLVHKSERRVRFTTNTYSNNCGLPLTRLSIRPVKKSWLLKDLREMCATYYDHRASDKGFLPISVADYLNMMDRTARQLRTDRRGSTPETAKPIFERLGIDADIWCELTRDFGRLFSTIAGKPKLIEMTRSRSRHQRYKIRSRARELLTTQPSH